MTNQDIRTILFGQPSSIIMNYAAAFDMAVNALERQDDPDRVRVVRCSDCRYWEPENAEEGDYSGHCKRSFGICYGQVTDAIWFCADGEREG
jgi:hypothetical protein